MAGKRSHSVYEECSARHMQLWVVSAAHLQPCQDEGAAHADQQHVCAALRRAGVRNRRDLQTRRGGTVHTKMCGAVHLDVFQQCRRLTMHAGCHGRRSLNHCCPGSPSHGTRAGASECRRTQQMVAGAAPARTASKRGQEQRISHLLAAPLPLLLLVTALWATRYRFTGCLPLTVLGSAASRQCRRPPPPAAAAAAAPRSEPAGRTPRPAASAAAAGRCKGSQAGCSTHLIEIRNAHKCAAPSLWASAADRTLQKEQINIGAQMIITTPSYVVLLTGGGG
jgi:hypothetical protein